MKITGYSDKISAASGETLSFMVNCELPTYQVEIVRLICGDSNPAGPGIKEKVIKTPANKTDKGRKQGIESGSYVTIPHSSVLAQLESFSCQAMIWPTTPEKGQQVIMAKYYDRTKAGFALVISERDGSLALLLGDGHGNHEILSTGKPFLAREWYFVAASYDAKTKQVAIYQEPLVSYPLASDAGEVHTKTKIAQLGTSDAPLMCAACRTGTGKGKLDCKYNGKIDSPRLANRALSRAEMEMLKSGPVPTILMDAVVGVWDFSCHISSQKVTDVSPNQLHGQTVNLPARGMKGYNWTGESMNWSDKPEHYGAIHFHDDDLYDAGWEVDFTLTIPTTMKSGLYAARLWSGDEEDYIPFVVSPQPGKEKPIAFLLPTASYMAYANEHMGTNAGLSELVSGRLVPLDKCSLFLNEHREYGSSCYDAHSDHSGVCYSLRLRPMIGLSQTRNHGFRRIGR